MKRLIAIATVAFLMGATIMAIMIHFTLGNQ